MLLGGSVLVEAGSLVWDSQVQKHQARPGETNIPLVFKLTNGTASGDVIITAVRPSCGCTTARMPPLPWRLPPGNGGWIEASVDIRGKRGTISKVIFVETSDGTNLLSLVISVPEDRMRNQELALADRQAVFRGECASCHVHPATGQKGAALYGLACGICHDSEHRATMVPSLSALLKPTDRGYWDQWIRHGKVGTLMPAFAQTEGGPLSENQIQSLVEYLGNRPQPIVVPVGTGE
jgi:mono/diheme cytochrome c family protein